MERLKSHRDFVAVLKHRRKAVGSDVVVHYQVCAAEDAVGLAAPLDLAAQLLEAHGAQSERGSGERGEHGAAESYAKRRIGLAVAKSVGNAVTRNAVKRRFRVLARSYESLLPEHCNIVLRAKPSAAHASFAALDAQFAALFARVRERSSERKHAC